MQNIPRWLVVGVVAVVVIIALVLMARREHYAADTCGDVVKKFCDKHYGKDTWSIDSTTTFNDQLVFAVIRTFDGGQTELSILPQSRTIIIEGTTSAKTPTRRIHRA